MVFCIKMKKINNYNIIMISFRTLCKKFYHFFLTSVKKPPIYNYIFKVI